MYERVHKALANPDHYRLHYAGIQMHRILKDKRLCIHYIIMGLANSADVDAWFWPILPTSSSNWHLQGVLASLFKIFP
jgi:hypothetical protein